LKGNYIIIDEYGKKDLKKGTLAQTQSGLYYFVSDFNKARRFDSIPRYSKSAGVGEFLRLVDYKTRKYIDM
jgi:hypothetical protein